MARIPTSPRNLFQRFKMLIGITARPALDWALPEWYAARESCTPTMEDTGRTPSPIRFATFEVDLRAGELRKHGLKIRLQEQQFQILAMLLERPGEVVTREELREKLWPSGTFVDFDHSLNSSINKLREALGDSADNPRFVETLPRRGYRFIFPLESAVAVPTEPPRAREAEPAPGRPWGAVRVAWLALAGTVLLVALVPGLRDFLLRRVRPNPGRIQSLAVIPLANLSGDPEQEPLTEGIHDALITNLAKIRALRVISRTSVMSYKDARKPLPQIAQELNVDAIVEGTVVRSGNKVRITIQLLHGPTDRHLWADEYEREFRDVVTLQGEVARAIADQIRIQLTPQEAVRLASARTVIPEAYEAYLKGRYHLSRRTPESLRRSIEYFNQTIQLDAHSALAYSGLADAYALLGSVPYDVSPPREVMPKAEQAVMKALELDDSLAEAYISLAHIRENFTWDWAGAEQGYKRALELNPSYAAGHQWYASFLVRMGRSEEAIAEIQHALHYDPLSPIIGAGAAEVYYLARRYDQAIEQCRETLDLDPNFFIAHHHLGRAYAEKKMYPEAIASLQKARTLSHNTAATTAVLGHAYAVSGSRQQALETLNELRVLSKQRYVPAIYFAAIYVGLGDKEQAFQWLERAYRERTDRMTYLNTEPMADPVRSDLRFRNLMRRIGFVPQATQK